MPYSLLCVLSLGMSQRLVLLLIGGHVSDLGSVCQPQPGPRPSSGIPGGTLHGLEALVMAAEVEVEVEARDLDKAAAVTASAPSKMAPASTSTRLCPSAKSMGY